MSDSANNTDITNIANITVSANSANNTNSTNSTNGTKWSITTDVYRSDEDPKRVESVRFTFETLGVKLVIRFEDASDASAQDWEKLVSPQGHKITFCDENGFVGLDSDGKNVRFSVAKMGAGGDGSISITVLLAACRKAILLVRDDVKDIQDTVVNSDHNDNNDNNEDDDWASCVKCGGSICGDCAELARRGSRIICEDCYVTGE